MPSLQDIRTAGAELPKGQPLVAALPGGTTGIGSYIAKALATVFADQGPKLRVYIIGRNASRAEAVISQCQTISPGSEWRFIKATDLALISDVDRCCADIIQQENETPFGGGSGRLDLLYMTHCYPVLKERTTTKEGLDAFISTTYYSRIRFIMQLLPLLTASPVPGHVISVYAGGFEDGTSPGELPIGCPSDSIYGITSVRKHSTFMKTFLFEELAERYAGRLSLSHIYPGLVDGPVFYSTEMPKWFRVVWRLAKPLVRWYMTSPDVCGLVMVYLGTSHFPAKTQGPGNGSGAIRSTNGELGGGAYGVGQRGDPPKGIRYEKVRKEDTSKLVWDHTMETLQRAANSHQNTSS